uniref:long-chain-fatty-acid--CoA ligase n=1 Tax=Strongyloides papillosus TaxID=174720 RepID=A0A0N5BFZ9_STREA
MLRILIKSKHLNKKCYIHTSMPLQKAISIDHTPTAHEKIHKHHDILLRPEEMIKTEMSMWTKTCLGIVNGCFIVSDAIAYIPNAILKKGENQLKLSRKTKSLLIEEDDFCKIYTNPNNKNGQLLKAEINGIETLDKYLDYTFNKFSDKKILGERVIDKIFEFKDNYGRKTKLLQQSDYKWETYEELNFNIKKIRSGLRKLGFKKGDKILFYSETRKEYLTTMLACIKEGIVVATYNPSMSLEEIDNILGDLNVDTIVSDESNFEKLDKICKGTKSINNIIYFKDRQRLSKSNPNKPAAIDERKEIPKNVKENLKNMLPYDEFLNYCMLDKPLDDVKIDKNDVALICYTSGTTAQPKGCVITHSNMLANIKGYNSDINCNSSNSSYVAYLPLSYIFEICGELICLYNGIPIGYSTTTTLTRKSMKVVPGTEGDLDALKPTIIPTVPTLLNRFKRVIANDLMTKSQLQQKLFTVCYNRKLNRKIQGLKTPILDKVIFEPIANFLGGNAKMIISGGAPVDKNLQRFCQLTSNTTFIQGYGATEGCAVSLSSPDDITTGNVGGPLLSTNIMITNWDEGNCKIEDNKGELWISGPNVINNYYKDYDDGSFMERNGVKWFNTGDIVKIKNDGAIEVIGRKKNFIKNANGEYISLDKIEKNLLNSLYVNQICVVVDPQLDYITAIVVVNKKAIKKIGEKLNIQGSVEELCKHKMTRSVVVYALEEEFKDVLSKYEIPRKVILVTEPFNQQNGMLTSSGKLKRNVIEESYKHIIKDIYTPYKDDMIEPEYLNENPVEKV